MPARDGQLATQLPTLGATARHALGLRLHRITTKALMTLSACCFTAQVGAIGFCPYHGLPAGCLCACTTQKLAVLFEGLGAGLEVHDCRTAP